MRHQAAARLVTQYDANNTYQYVINREDVQLTWVAAAIAGLGGAAGDAVLEPARSANGKAADVLRAILEEDVRDAQAFVDHWRPRCGRSNASEAAGVRFQAPRGRSTWTSCCLAIRS